MTEFLTTTIQLAYPDNKGNVAVEVVAEPTVCPHLVITPSVGIEKGGRPYFTGGVRLTHTGTGRAVSHADHSHQLHRLAQKLVDELPGFDWNFTDVNHLYASPKRREAAGVIRDWQMSDAFDGPAELLGDDEEKKAARQRDPAGTLLAEQLDWWIEHSKHYMDGLDWDNPDHQRARVAEIATSCEGYAAIYLLAVLRAINPRVADIAARDLISALDAGDVLGEWVWQWRKEFAEGKPLTLHGIPAADPLADFAKADVEHQGDGNVPTPTTEPRRDWCCGTPMTKPHTPGCSFEPREDNPIDYSGPIARNR
ncbi:hypothetical protein SEA_IDENTITYCRISIS_50 [Mycobacterium phage IdentityCrisis]|uniref:Uncharacterized protein n=1 Tax=Mycobacterium phage IdentityCrisis TaxID=2599866 RepID=A0A5J6TK01_9CAUD|nr:hypothetical protein QEH37_gp49 [Mycobacterium phage IdentityCrisis]QFG10069.1 hypothetical protein SEA_IDENTITYCRISIS_50 [Mycobacterium phage IdentityCrisis]